MWKDVLGNMGTHFSVFVLTNGTLTSWPARFRAAAAAADLASSEAVIGVGVLEVGVSEEPTLDGPARAGCAAAAGLDEVKREMGFLDA